MKSNRKWYESRAHSQSPIPLPAWDWFLATDSYCLVPQAPRIYPLSALPWGQSCKQLEVRPNWFAIALCSWLRSGWDGARVRCMPHSIMKSWQLYGAFSRPLKRASHSQSRYWEFLSMKVETTWGSHICCGLGQQTLGKATLPSPPPARLLLNHFVLSSTNYVAGST